MEKVPDVTLFPPPSYHKFNVKYYGKWRPVQATRGCPFPCTFCSISEFFKRRRAQIKAAKKAAREA